MNQDNLTSPTTDYSEIHQYYDNYNWNTGENDLNEYLQEHYVFTGEQLNKRLELVEIKDNLQNHLVFDHSYTDYITPSITFLNLALIIYLFYKLNTNKTR